MRLFHLATIFVTLFSLSTITFANTNPAVITAENADQVRLLNTFGRGRLQDVLWSSRNVIAVESNIGIWLYEGIDDEAPTHIAIGKILTFSEDGQWLIAYSTDYNADTPYGTISIYDVASGQIVKEIHYEAGEWNDVHVRHVALSPDRTSLYTASSELRRYDLRQSETTFIELDDSSFYIKTLDMNTDGTQLAYNIQVDAYVSETRIMDIQSNELLLTIPSLGDFYSDVSEFSNDGSQMLFTTCKSPCSDNAELILWDLENNQEMLREAYSEYPLWLVDSATYSPDGNRIAVVDRQSNIYLLDSLTLQITDYLPVFHYPDGELTSDREAQVAFSPDSQHLVSISDNQRVLVWNIETGSIERELHAFEFGISRELDISPNDESVDLLYFDEFSSGDESYSRHSIRSLNTAANEINYVTPVDSGGAIFQFWQHPTEDILFTVSFGAGYIRDSQTGNPITRFLTGNFMTTGALSGDGSTFVITDCKRTDGLASCDQGNEVWYATIIDRKTFEERLTINFPFQSAESIYDVALSDDGEQLLIQTKIGLVTIWDTTTGELLQSWHNTCDIAHTDANAHFMTDNRVIYARLCDPFEIVIWDFERGSWTVFESESHIHSMDVSPDRNLVVVLTDKLQIIDITSHRILATFDVSARKVRFSADGTRLFALGDQLYTFGIEDN